LTPPGTDDAAAGADRSSAATKADELLHVLRRHWATVLAVVLTAAAASYAYSASQAPRYAASADVLLSRQDLAASLNDITDPGLVTGDLNRVAQTEANLATAPAVIALALESAGLPQSQAGTLLRNSSVSAKPTADILTFRVEDGNEAKAVRLAAAYARSYTIYRRTLDSAGITRALTRVRGRLKELRASSQRNKNLITSLSGNEDRLSTLAAFQASKAFVVRSPRTASQVSPKPRRALLLGLFLGTLLGVGVVLLRQRIDTHVQDVDQVAELLGMPLLATIPELPKKLRQSHELVMLSDPNSPGSEAFRVLRTSVEFASIDGDAKTIMVSSAVQAEGKSTTLANLAVAFARAGKRVVLVDLDLRRPYIAKFFRLGGRQGLTDVALGRLSLHEALVDIDLSRAPGASVAGVATNGHGADPAQVRQRVTADDQRRGGLRVLASGLMPPDTGEFVASDRVRSILAELERDADIVLIDAPPLLSVSDALALSRQASALLLVARLGIVRRPMLKEVTRVLERCPARVLGCVVTSVQASHGYGYGYGYGYTSTNATMEPVEEAKPVAPVS